MAHIERKIEEHGKYFIMKTSYFTKKGRYDKFEHYSQELAYWPWLDGFVGYGPYRLVGCSCHRNSAHLCHKEVDKKVYF